MIPKWSLLFIGLVVALSNLGTTFVNYSAPARDSFTYLDDAISAGDDSLYVEVGTYTDSSNTANFVFEVDTDGWLIVGNPEVAGTGDDSCKVDGQSLRRAAFVDTSIIVTFEDLQFKNGWMDDEDSAVPYKGGLLFISPQGQATFKGCKFNGGWVPRGKGGQIYLAQDAVAVFDSCQFYGLPKAEVGSAIFADSPDSLIIKNCSFYDLTDKAVWVEGDANTDVLIYNSSFYNVSGDALALYGSYNSCIIDVVAAYDIEGQILRSPLQGMKAVLDSVYVTTR